MEMNNMQNFINALQKNIAEKNWYSVLFTCLTLPDICGKIDEPDAGSKARSVNWFNKYIQPIYTTRFNGDSEDHIFLHGEDFYALRCAYLHEGSDDITTQRARKILNNFKFVVAPQGWVIHRNQVGQTLQLQIDIFGEEIISGLETWLDDIQHDAIKKIKIDSMCNIEIIDPSRGFAI